MKLKAIFAASTAAVLAQASPALAQAEISLEGVPADELSVARDIILVMYPKDERDEIFQDMVQQTANQFAAASMTSPVFEEPGIREIMDEFFAGLSGRLMPVIKKHMPSILEATAVAYTREFSLEELESIHAFARTEAGSHYFRKVTSLLADPAVAEANQAYFAEVQSMQGAIQTEIREKLMAYLSENPEVVERLQQRNPASN